MKKLLIFILALGAAAAGKAQQLQTSSLYDMQGIIHNPAMAGTIQKGMLGATYRTQWSGISGSPKTITAFGSFRLNSQNFGVGGYLFNDVTGPTSRTGITASFAKHIPLENGGVFSVGIEAKGQQYQIDKTKLSTALSGDPILAGSSSKFQFDAGLGAAVVTKKFQLGVAVSQLVQTKLNYYTGNLTTSEEGRLYRHYFMHGLYNWQVDKNTVITPNFLFIYLPNAPKEFQAGVRVEHNELFWYGVSVRAKQSFMLSAGVNVNKNFTLGYSFDIYRTPLSIYDAGANAHEILLRYNILN